MAERLRFVCASHPTHVAAFGEDVRAGLGAARKTLPSKYFYDAIGSALFETIALLPEYYPTRAEAEILREYGCEIVRSLGSPIEFLELGGGSAAKTRLLIDEALQVQGDLHYAAIDVSPEALRLSARALVQTYPRLRVTAYAADYFAVLGTPDIRLEGRALALFMGSNIGNYEPPEAVRLLRSLHGSLRGGDGLLVGADLKKDRETLERAYDDPTGVTAAFDKNLLARINRELGGTFDPRDFKHVAIYDEARGCVDSFLEAIRAHEVLIADLALRITFHRGERIHTESSYKFTIDDIARIGAEAGFRLARSWADAGKRFGVSLLLWE